MQAGPHDDHEVEADGCENSACILPAAASVSTAIGAPVYATGELDASRLKLNQFLLLRVGPFPDLWEKVARDQLDRQDQTAALVASERATAGNPGWGCCVWLQCQLLAALGRTEEQRDLALAALEAPLWTLGAPLEDVQQAAQLEHVEDVHALFKELDEQLRTQQGAADRSPKERALLGATEMLDRVVKEAGSWDAVRPQLAVALEEAGLVDAADLAAG